MRPGLVVVGGLLVTLGASALASIYVLAPPAPTTTTSITGAPVSVPARQEASTPPISLVTSGAATLRVTWQSTTDVNASLTAGTACAGLPPACGTADTLASGGGRSALWVVGSPGRGPIYITWYNNGSVAASVRYTIAETVASPDQLPAVVQLLVDIALGSLTAIGGLALFLGLFLRGGVYRRPAPLVSRSADDAEAIAGDPSGGAPPPTGPRTGSSGGGSG